MENALTKQITEKLSQIKAGDIMTKNVATTAPDTPLMDLANMLRANRISGVPVVDRNGNVVGVITSVDLFLAMGVLKYGTTLQGEKTLADFPVVSTVMAKNVITLTEDATLNDVIDKMINRGIHTLPIMRGGRLVGVIGRHDVLKHFYTVVAPIIKNIAGETV